MEKWKLYTLTNVWTGRVFVGVTSLDDALKCAEQHASKATNEELFRDLRLAGLEHFSFRVVTSFARREDAFLAEAESVRFFVAHVGPYGLYNRCESGPQARTGERPELPRSIRDALVAKVRRGPQNKALSDKTIARLVRTGFATQFRAKGETPDFDGRARTLTKKRRKATRADRLEVDLKTEERKPKRRPTCAPTRDGGKVVASSSASVAPNLRGALRPVVVHRRPLREELLPVSHPLDDRLVPEDREHPALKPVDERLRDRLPRDYLRRR